MTIFQKISDFFKNLQQKPENVRRRWLWIFVISIMVLILVFWGFSFTKDIQANLALSPSPSPTVPEATPIPDSSPNFFQVFVNGFKKIISGVMEFLRPLAEAVAKFFVTIFSLVLKAGNWAIRELTSIFNAITNHLQSNTRTLEVASLVSTAISLK